MKIWLTGVAVIAPVALSASAAYWFASPFSSINALGDNGNGNIPYVLPSLTLVEVQVILQGRGENDYSGTEVTLSRDGVPLPELFVTPSSGDISFDLIPGNYRLFATHLGWLSDALEFVVDEDSPPIELGTIELLAGDADGDDDVDSIDLTLFGRGLNKVPAPDAFTDVSGDGTSCLFDLAHGALNFGRRAPSACTAATPGDPNGPGILSAKASLNPGNSLIVDFDVTIDTPSNVYVEYVRRGASRVRSKTTESLGTSHSFSVVRLRPLTIYCFQVFALNAQGQVSESMPGSFRSGPLPDGLKDSVFTVTVGQPT